MAKRELLPEDLTAPMVVVEDTPSKYSLTPEDLFPTKEKVAEPFEEGSTLKVTVPLPGEWPEFDTGVLTSRTTAQNLAGAGKRLTDVQNRLKQGMNKVVPSAFPGIQAEIDQEAIRSKPLMDTTGGMLGSMLPDIAASAAYPPNLANTLRGAGIQGFFQGLATPTTSDEENGTALNTALGTIGGGAGHVVGRGITGALGKVAHVLPELIPDSVRRMAQNVKLKLPETVWSNPEQRRLYDLARSKGVPTMIGDIDPTSSWASAETSTRPFWSGRNAFMQEQQDATRKVLTDLESQLATTPKGTEGSVISKGVKEAYKTAKEQASKLFDDVEDVAGRSANLTPIKPNQTYMAAKAAVADYPTLFDEFKDQSSIRKLLGLAEDTGPQNGRIINPATSNDVDKMKPFKYDQELGFDDARFLRKKLGAWYDKLKSQLDNGSLPVGVDGEAVKHAAEIFGAFNRDIDAWGKQAGNEPLNKAWSKAREFYKNEVLPFRDPARLNSKSSLVKNIVNDAVDTDSIVTKALPSQETSIAGDIMDHTTDAGKAAMKSALIRKMVDPSINPDLQGLGNVSLLRNTSKLGHTGDYVFSPTERQAVTDAHDIARLTRRSAEAGTTPPPTGARTLPFMSGSALMGTAGAAYMGLGALGDSIDPTTRILLAGTVAPAGALSLMQGMNRYSGSALGKNLHFADPALRGALGRLQQIVKQGIRGAGEPLERLYTHGALGHRED